MEGPSIVILKEELKRFEKKKVLRISGNSKEPLLELEGKTLKRIETWGKTIYFIFSGGIVTRTHFLMFGSYRIDEPKEERVPRVQFDFSNGVVYFYTCAFTMDAKLLFDELDQRINVLSQNWDEAFVLKLMQKKKEAFLCDLFLDQTLFAGSGNIVKNEVLFNLRRHPLTRLSEIKPSGQKLLVRAVREYCENFYEWKKVYELRQHWQVYKRRYCRVCETKLEHEKMGQVPRSTFFCPRCQSKKRVKEKLVLHEVLPLPEKKIKEKRLDH